MPTENLTSTETRFVDLADSTVRALNQSLHQLPKGNTSSWRILNPRGLHSIAVGLNAPLTVDVEGHVGYYCAGMNQHAHVTVHGNCGTGVAENIMSGSVRVKGDASQCAGATGNGGLLIIEGNASSRCGISLKGTDIVVGGSVGHFSAFMAQLGNLVICGDASDALGDSLYEANIFLRGKVASLGADCEEKEMTPAHLAILTNLLDKAGFNFNPSEFRLYGSARKLYNFNIDHSDEY